MKPIALILAVLAGIASTAFAKPDDGQVIFATRQSGAGGHWYENFGYYAQDPNHKLYGAMGRLCKLNLSTGELTVLLDDPKGAVRDPQVHYDGGRILFSYRKGGSEHYHLYEINIDGTGLKQLTDGVYDDIEPTYLPDGRIVFCSSRCNQWVPCWFSQVAVLYTCDGDGRNIRRISANIEHDNTPWMLPDGRVLYERWEYVDRSRVAFHHLWTMNPDGTGQMVYFGNQHPGTVMLDAKPIPGTDKVVSIFSPGHGKKEHAGAVAIVSPNAGPDEKSFSRRISRTEDFRDPYPLSASQFLVARGASLLIMDEAGETREVYRLPAEIAKQGVECHEPRLLESRPREPVIPSRLDLSKETGTLILSDIHIGRRMEGVGRGEIKKLLVLETLPKPVNDSGKMPPISFLGTYTLERILGTVPVEADGSAHFDIPALRSIFFVALDENNNSVKRMHSFMTVQPGETQSCVGCHEYRNESPRTSATPAALRRPASPIAPLANIPDVFDFPRDVQPILDRHCVACHGGKEGDESTARPNVPSSLPTAYRLLPTLPRLLLTGDRGPVYSHAYYTLIALRHVIDGRDTLNTNLPPRSVGTSASPLMRLLDGSHYDAKLSQHEQDMIRYWIESAAPYAGTYASIATGQIGGYPKSQLDTTDRKWPESVAAAEAISRRCTSCHDKTKPMPRYLSDDLGLVLSNPDEADPRLRWSRHRFFNLSRPDRSLILLAPLAKQAGGLGVCAGKERPVFAAKADPDYVKILSLCLAGQRHLNTIKRFDMAGFRPHEWYTREMKRFGILPAAWQDTDPIDTYTTDQAYWRSLWYRPQSQP